MFCSHKFGKERKKEKKKEALTRRTFSALSPTTKKMTTSTKICM
jgi:hypothetical protein